MLEVQQKENPAKEMDLYMNRSNSSLPKEIRKKSKGRNNDPLEARRQLAKRLVQHINQHITHNSELKMQGWAANLSGNSIITVYPRSTLKERSAEHKKPKDNESQLDYYLFNETSPAT